jgi:hypothetical protein
MAKIFANFMQIRCHDATNPDPVRPYLKLLLGLMSFAEVINRKDMTDEKWVCPRRSPYLPLEERLS